ncbi:MAG: hypothetical protein IPJ11_08735 [Gemmatimonadetes bacterium]|nr:hypothetical protein [Gemmatimonadota bacterium]
MFARNSMLALLLLTLAAPHSLLAQSDTAQANRAKRELKRAELPDTVIVEPLPAADRLVVAVADFDFTALFNKKRYDEKSDLGRFAAALQQGGATNQAMNSAEREGATLGKQLAQRFQNLLSAAQSFRFRNTDPKFLETQAKLGLPAAAGPTVEFIVTGSLLELSNEDRDIAAGFGSIGGGLLGALSKNRSYAEVGCTVTHVSGETVVRTTGRGLSKKGGGGGIGGFAKGFIGAGGARTSNEQEAAYTQAIQRAVQNCVADITMERAVLTRFLIENGYRGGSPQ